MSFDIFLQRFCNGETAEVDWAVIHAVISTRSYQGPNAYGCFDFSFADGTDCELFAQRSYINVQFNSCMFALRSASLEAARLILDVARAGEMTILAAMEDNCIILPDASLQVHLPHDMLQSFGHCVTCTTAEELHAILYGGYRRWQVQRDSVTGYGENA